MVVWAITSGMTGIKMIHDRDGTVSDYPLNHPWSAIDTRYDTDGLLGTEIIVAWNEYSYSNGIKVIHDRNGTVSDYPVNHTSWQPAYGYDTDGLPGTEIIVAWNEWAASNGVKVIHDSNGTTNDYPVNLADWGTFIRDYDHVAGAEICYEWHDPSYYPSSGYKLITDRTRTQTATSTCTNTDPNQPPVIAITPPSVSSYAGTAQNLTVVYSDSNGATDLSNAYIILRADMSAQTNAIKVRYLRASNQLYLLNDAATTWLGPCTPGSANIISNTQGTLNCGQTSVNINGNDLTINWNITPKTTYGGTKNMYFEASDAESLDSGIIQKNTWRIYSPPYISTYPPTGSSYAGNAQNFTVVYSDLNGARDISYAYIGWLSNPTSYANAIILTYTAATNDLCLADDSGTTCIGTCKPGAAMTISNSQGILNCARTTVILNGNNLTINWNMIPKTTYRGTKNMYFDASDAENLDSGIIQKNTWTIK